jgi:hypothetical protein
MAASFLLGLAPAAALAPAPAYAVQSDIGECLSQGSDLDATLSDGCDPAAPGEGTRTISDIVTLVVNIFSIIVGIVAVIMIIWGGFKYITSGGDSGNITSAKNTIIYAIIGLVIVALAQFIVQFVLEQVTDI